MPRLPRRAFLRASAALGAAWSIGCGDPDEPPPSAATAIVIGSGFGGAVAAYRLAMKGIDTLVLERGRRWPILPTGDTFCTWESPDQRCAWLATSPTFPESPPAIFDPYVGLIERIQGPTIDVITASAVGGGSVVYGTTSPQPAQPLFTKLFPAEIDYAEMDATYFPRVRAMIGMSPLPDDVIADPRYGSARTFVDALKKSTLHWKLEPSAVDWDIVRKELAGTAIASLVNGEMLYGVNSGAKNSLDRNYLAQAEASGKCTIAPLHVVTSIAQEGDGGRYRVEANLIDEQGNVRERRVLRCEYLFLAAGSMGTTRLLVRAKAKGDLPHLNADVGLHWGNNGDYLIARVLDGVSTASIQGAPASTLVYDHDAPNGPLTLEHGTGATGVECHCQPVLGMGIPQANGAFVYDRASDDASLQWSRDDMGTIPDDVKASLGALDAVAGGTILDITQQTGLHTYHPLGGAVLGRACDLEGRVVGHAKLYVVDSSLVPGSVGCANPSLTIAAIAERCMDRILAKDFG